MKKVLIVDDETIIRVTLRSMHTWESYGFEISEDFMSPKQALLYLKHHKVDLIVTDMKMPDMDGLEFLEHMQKLPHHPVTVVLSGYNEFELVREAFKRGAYDYILKSDLQEDMLSKLLKNLNEKIVWDGQEEKGIELSLKEETQLIDGKYAVVLFEITDFQKQVRRVGKNWDEKLETPFLELARQIPRFAAKAIIKSIFPSRYVMYYKVADENLYQSHIVSIVKQLQSVWKNYMNLDVSAAISESTDVKDLEKTLDDMIKLMKTAILEGNAAVCKIWEQKEQMERILVAEEQYMSLITAIYSADEIGFEAEKKILLQKLRHLDYKEAVEECLSLIVLLAQKFKEYNDDFLAMFPEEINYYDKLKRLSGVRDLELWIHNYLRWILEYCTNKHESRQADLILRAKRFIADNYMTPELTLGSVADYVGLNEKYFSSKFTRETGITFSNYLIDIRIQKAKDFLNTTDLKMYEISERVGYNNVEHFNRLFKRQLGISPGDYKKGYKIQP